MTKLFYVVAMVVLVAILACGGEEGTEAPTGTSAQQATVVGTTTPESTAKPLPTPTPEPTATPVPTPMPEPTLTPVPAPTEAPAVMTGMGAITPLLLDDPLAIAGELSEAELACAAGVADLSRLLQIFSAPEHASPEELTQLIGCLEDETVLRLFVTTIVGLEDPLSKETSECVRAGMEGIDARAVILSGMAGDEQAAMMGSMAAFTLILTCLNEEEFAAAAPALDIDPEEREGFLCLMGELGGADKLAAAFSGQDEQAMLALIGATISCGLEMEGDAMPPQMPTTSPAPTPEGVTTPSSSTGTATEGGPITVLPIDDPLRMASELSPEEIACLAGGTDISDLTQILSAPELASPEQQGLILGCFEDETVLRMFLTGFIGDSGSLSEETSMCIRGGASGVDLRSMMLAGEEDEAAMVGAMSVMFIMASCLNEEEFEEIAPAMGMASDDRESFECVMQTMGGPEGMAATFAAEDEASFAALVGAIFTCGLEMGPGP